MGEECDEEVEAVVEAPSSAGDINQAATSPSPSPSNSESRPVNDAGANHGRPMEALLIANSDYSNFPKLGSPKTDALILGDSLRKLGFATRLVENASREQMLDEIKAFEDRLKKIRGIAFFHFGGHGIQVDGTNYLIPADADIPDERRVSTRAVELNEVMGALEASGSEVNIVVLDACRDNPLPASATRSATRGLAVVGSKPKNSIVIYAAEAGSKANDGLFTPVLARELTASGRSLSEIMTRVRKEVNEKSGGTQTPGEYTQLFEQVFFNAGQGRPVAAMSTPNRTPYPDRQEVELLQPRLNAGQMDQKLNPVKTNGMEFIDGASNFRSGPGFGFPVKYQPPKGAWCEVIGKQGSWVHVRMKNGDQGWVDRGNIKPAMEMQTYSGGYERSSPQNTDYRETFTTSITQNDIFNSSGVQLNDPVLVLMQDRANVHKFGNPDNDTRDRFFASKEHMARIRSYLNRGSFPETIRRSIMRGNGQVVRFSIYQNSESKYCIDIDRP